jgi:enoyl-CoA hydratase/carnithine racemase
LEVGLGVVLMRRIAELTDLNAGLKLERELYYASFSLEDRTEGMKAFVEKRKPVFMDR